MRAHWGLGATAPVGTRARPSDLSLVSAPELQPTGIGRGGDETGWLCREKLMPVHVAGEGGLHQTLPVPCAGAAGWLSPICCPLLQLPPPPACHLPAGWPSG